MILQQIQKNSLAIVSLIVAFSALGYNTWRNELTESNRNVRQAGFEMLLHIGELQKQRIWHIMMRIWFGVILAPVGARCWYCEILRIWSLLDKTFAPTHSMKPGESIGKDWARMTMLFWQ